jgi:hypothetical protein
LGRDVEVASSTGSPFQANLLSLCSEVFFHILLGTLEDYLALGLGCLAEETSLASLDNNFIA